MALAAWPEQRCGLELTVYCGTQPLATAPRLCEVLVGRLPVSLAQLSADHRPLVLLQRPRLFPKTNLSANILGKYDAWWNSLKQRFIKAVFSTRLTAAIAMPIIFSRLNLFIFFVIVVDWSCACTHTSQCR